MAARKRRVSWAGELEEPTSAMASGRATRLRDTSPAPPPVTTNTDPVTGSPSPPQSQMLNVPIETGDGPTVQCNRVLPPGSVVLPASDADDSAPPPCSHFTSQTPPRQAASTTHCSDVPYLLLISRLGPWAPRARQLRRQLHHRRRWAPGHRRAAQDAYRRPPGRRAGRF